MKSTIFLALAASPLALVATAMPVAAQDSADQSMANASMDDIVVTARRREESLQSVPVSITAISSDMLEQKSRSEEHTHELQSLMRQSYAAFCLKTTIKANNNQHTNTKYHYIQQLENKTTIK